jgi:hypothetical protein
MRTGAVGVARMTIRGHGYRLLAATCYVLACGCRQSHPARSRDQSVSMDQTEDSVVATQPRRLGIVDWRR